MSDRHENVGPRSLRENTGATSRPPRFNTSGRGGVGRGLRMSNPDRNWRDRSDSYRVRGFRYNPNRRNQQQAPITNRIILVPSDQVGRIIGRGGSKIREIEFSSNTRIQVGNSGATAETDVTIRGTEENIFKAERIINDMLRATKPIPLMQAPNPPTLEEDTIDNYGSKSSEPEQASSSTREKADIIVESTLQSELFQAPSTITTEDLDGVKPQVPQKFYQKKLDKFLPPVVKNFYFEDTEIANLSYSAVANWRKANRIIQVRRFLEDKQALKPIPNPVLTFEQAFEYHPRFLNLLLKRRYKQPSPVQSQVWPILLSGEDLLIITQGKTQTTMAILLPAMIHAEGQLIPVNQRQGPSALFIVPTKERALEIEKTVTKLQYKGIKTVCVYGGGNRREQIEKVSKGMEIIIATPGRLYDFVMTNHIKTRNVSFVVIDGADRLLDMDFDPQIQKSLVDVRPDAQTVITSATLPSVVRCLAHSYMNDPVQLKVEPRDLPVELSAVTQQK